MLWTLVLITLWLNTQSSAENIRTFISEKDCYQAMIALQQGSDEQLKSQPQVFLCIGSIKK